MKKQLTSLLLDYRVPKNPCAEPDSDRELEKENEKKAQQASAIFQAAFGNFPEFSLSALEDFSETGFDAGIQKLHAFSQQLQWPEGSESGRWRMHTNDPEELCVTLDQFNDDSLWPFVRIVRVYLDSPILEAGVVLADAPGFRDMNVARGMVFKGYQGDCDGVLIVTNIGRVMTNMTVKEALEDVQLSTSIGEGFGIPATIVCTHSLGVNTTPIDNAYKGLLDNEQYSTALAAHEAAKKSRKGKAAAALRLRSVIAAARNKYIKNCLPKQYEHLDIPGMLPVFCVDNQVSQDADDEEAEELSGIPALQKHCSNFPAKQSFLFHDNRIGYKIPSLVNKLIAYFQAGQTHQSHYQFANIFPAQCNAFGVVSSNFKEFLELCFDNKILKIFRDNQQTFNKAAAKVAHKWVKWNGATYLAFCRRNGSHDTKAIGKHNWNDEMTKAIRGPMKIVFADMANTINVVGGGLTNDLIKNMKDLSALAKKHEMPETFLNDLAMKQRQLPLDVCNRVNETLKEFNKIRDLTIKSSPESYIFQYMESTYEDCARDEGGGMGNRAKERIRRKLADDSITRYFMNRCGKDLAKWATESGERVVQTIRIVTDDMQEQVSAMASGEAPGVLAKYPDFAQEMRSLLLETRTIYPQINRLAEPAREKARQLEYISAQL